MPWAPATPSWRAICRHCWTTKEPAGCLERAVTTGAFAVASHGDWEGAPTRSELGMLGAPPGTVVR